VCSYVSDLKLRSTSSAEKNFADDITWITWKTEQNLEIWPFLNSRLEMWVWPGESGRKIDPATNVTISHNPMIKTLCIPRNVVPKESFLNTIRNDMPPFGKERHQVNLVSSKLIAGKPPFLCWVVPWSRAVCKGFHDEMRPSHLVVKSFTHSSWSGNIENGKKPPGRRGIFRSKQCPLQIWDETLFWRCAFEQSPLRSYIQQQITASVLPTERTFLSFFLSGPWLGSLSFLGFHFYFNLRVFIKE